MMACNIGYEAYTDSDIHGGGGSDGVVVVQDTNDDDDNCSILKTQA